MDLRQYLANILLVCGADSRVVDSEGKALEAILRDLGAGLRDLKAAAREVEAGRMVLAPTGRISEQVRNLEDMILAAAADGEIPEKEKEILIGFAKEIGIGKTLFNKAAAEAKQRAGELS